MNIFFHKLYVSKALKNFNFINVKKKKTVTFNFNFQPSNVEKFLHG